MDPTPTVGLLRTEPIVFRYRMRHRGVEIDQRYWVWIVRDGGDVRVAIDHREVPDLFAPSQFLAVEDAMALLAALTLGLRQVEEIR